jgi:pimeloyl-ACP methyl ester carboxylesterase
MHQPLQTDLPILIVVGQMDGITPLRMAREIAANAKNTKVVEIPDGGHLLTGLSHPECMDEIESSFIEHGTVEDLDTSCLRSLHRFPFVTATK